MLKLYCVIGIKVFYGYKVKKKVFVEKYIGSCNSLVLCTQHSTSNVERNPWSPAV